MSMIRRVTSGLNLFYQSTSWSLGNGGSYGWQGYANSYGVERSRSKALEGFAYGHAWAASYMDASSFDREATAL